MPKRVTTSTGKKGLDLFFKQSEEEFYTCLIPSLSISERARGPRRRYSTSLIPAFLNDAA